MTTSIVAFCTSSSNPSTAFCDSHSTTDRNLSMEKESLEQKIQSPTVESIRSETDAACALLFGHRQCPTSSPVPVVSYSLCSTIGTDEAQRQESSSSEGLTMMPKHGFVIESSSILDDFYSSCSSTTVSDSDTSTSKPTKVEIYEEPIPLPVQQRRPRSGSEGLDYLAFLAEQERHSFVVPDTSMTNSHMDGTEQQTIFIDVRPSTTIVNNPPSSSSSSSDTDDSETMPPPQPRRPRSVSNPDYMMNVQQQIHHQPSTMMKQHFVLPPHLLRQELAEARGAVVRKAAAAITNTPYRYSCTSSFRSSPTILEDSVYVQSSHNNFDYFNHPTTSEEEGDEDNETHPESGDEYDEDDDEVDISDEDQVVLIESTTDPQMDMSISPTELLRRARSRLLEDLLSESNSTSTHGVCDKSSTLLPHTLLKYKMVYNQNGRIGIYTPQERAAIIARYHSKRAHRNWNKKIRYNCRKSLADRRLRVKGRFVKRSISNQEPKDDVTTTNDFVPTMNDYMPDVNDPDAGFCPTVDQPYRRLRRHTVT